MVMLTAPMDDFPLPTQLEALNKINKWPVGTPRANTAALLREPPWESIVATYMTYLVKEKDVPSVIAGGWTQIGLFGFGSSDALEKGLDAGGLAPACGRKSFTSRGRDL